MLHVRPSRKDVKDGVICGDCKACAGARFSFGPALVRSSFLPTPTPRHHLNHHTRPVVLRGVLCSQVLVDNFKKTYKSCDGACHC